ncbi:MAG: LamG domain-containing protein [Deltaproteobacteria bacterium]|nr:LamG domain-containing protein [Deltaproteobacteria bacterium]
MSFRLRDGFSLLAPSLLLPSVALAAESARSVASPMGGNGHNVSFDGRVFVVTRGSVDGVGWHASAFRPEAVGRDAFGYPDVSAAFSDFIMVQRDDNAENALALCEPDAARAPFACNETGETDQAGPYACYDFAVFDSDALNPDANRMRKRKLMLWVRNPSSPSAEVHKFVWTEGITPIPTTLRGIEPTVTRDGRLMIYQGHPNNDGAIDVLMYSVNDTPCGLDGWSAPRVISEMATDSRTVGVWRLAERPFRATDGSLYAPGELVRGAYPWLFPEGDAVIFTAANMPCRAIEDPPGCGPRRNALSILGYPTNWGVAHIDGEVNPSTADTVRLFFSSPGRNRFSQLPVTPGLDVWPFFGSNTANYTEIVLDDGLDGQYAGVWHMNEVVSRSGDLDPSRTPDSSGYFNTARLLDGARFPAANNGRSNSSKAVELDGAGARLSIPHSLSLNPVNAMTVELSIFPVGDPDCDGNNNWRMLLGKGNINTGAYTLVFEESRQFQARVRVGAKQYSLWSNASIPVGQWSNVAFTYHADSGQMAFFVDGVETNRASYAPGQLQGSPDPLDLGGQRVASSCPDQDGTFFGLIDEVRISRVVRLGSIPAPDAGFLDAEAPDSGVSFEDASTGDAEVSLDLGQVAADATSADANSPDAGTGPTDAMLQDGSQGDGSSTPDALVPRDAAARDATPAPPPASDSSCACSSEPSAEGSRGLGFLVWALCSLPVRRLRSRRFARR